MPDVKALLGTLNAAKVQRSSNEAMRGALLEAEEKLQRLHANTFTQRLHHDLNNAHVEAEARLRIFTEGYSFSALRRPSHVARPAIAPGDGTELGERSTGSVFGLRQLGRVHERMGTLAQQFPEDSHARSNIDAMTMCIDRAQTVAREDGIDVSPWITSVTTMFDALADVAQIPTVETKIRNEAEEALQLETQLADATERHSRYEGDGNVAGIESTVMEIIALCERLQDVYAAQIAGVDKFRAEAIAETKARSSALRALCASELSTLVADHRDKTSAIEEIKAVTSNGKVTFGAQSTSLDTHAIEAESFERSLAANLEQQEREWVVIERAEHRLQMLSRERMDLVLGYMRSVEREAKRRADAAATNKDGVCRLAELVAHRKHCGCLRDVSEQLECVVSTAADLLDELTVHAEREFKRGGVECHRRYLSTYRTLCLTLGDVIHKKSAMADELEAKIEMATARQEICLDSLDPKAKQYTLEKETLAKEWGDLMHEVRALRRRAETHSTAFAATDVALIAAGIQYTDPREELRDRDRRRRDRISDYHEDEYQKMAVVRGLVPPSADASITYVATVGAKEPSRIVLQ
eukprot:PhM_4_TR1129/c0_g2_i1/m.37406